MRLRFPLAILFSAVTLALPFAGSASHCQAPFPQPIYCYCTYKNDTASGTCAGKTKNVEHYCVAATGPTSVDTDRCRQQCQTRGMDYLELTQNYNAQCDYDPATKCTTNVNGATSSSCPKTVAPATPTGPSADEKARADALARAQQGSVIGGTGSGTSASVAVIIGRVVNAVLGIVGSIAFLMFFYGGVLWMTAAGNEAKVKKGRDTIVWAVMGLIAIFAAYAIVNFILTSTLTA